jgi:hypothetical protein
MILIIGVYPITVPNIDLGDLWRAFESDSVASDDLNQIQLRRCQLELSNYNDNPPFVSAFLERIFLVLDHNWYTHF